MMIWDQIQSEIIHRCVLLFKAPALSHDSAEVEAELYLN